MAIRVFRDDRARQLLVIVTGAMHTEETRELMSTQARDGTWDYGVLYDLRKMTTSPSAEDLQLLEGHVDALSHDVKRGPVAIVGMTNPLQVARVAAYAERLESTGLRLALFDDIGAAERWLDSQHVSD